MTNYSSAARGPEPSRPGRKLGPIAANVGTLHRAWLGPIRNRHLDSGRTLIDLSERVPLSKSKLSELMRGVGHYPRWEVLHRLASELNAPHWPLYRLWQQAALDAGKSRDWIEGSTERHTLITTRRPGPPLEFDALRSMVELDYRRYARAFLTEGACKEAIEDAFAILWLSFNEALSSPDTRRFAWLILRSTVMARAMDDTGHPRLEMAAFDTVALKEKEGADLEACAEQLSESLQLFQAISKLPDAQLDVMVLRYLGGLTPQRTSNLLGVPLAAIRSDERHAKRNLERVIRPLPETGGPTS
ncbi:sigma-70 family RNA polymerase sigma factor [Streptomyces sp. B-S-A8]|uniref:Sigma-70 family RNA polymerase sigma factor n=1 Tax=Streptomyces solicavernae TaxID=3043614 RepID=A0ABT6S1S6_9ACTN|nr:sigma-70 family RNA polymerase sigma factor [Streptomyces sp. B-S-A8]MDI3390633.1 sigma-70 family RNA polymerase sigma factor [Streptomyces sp. B-S-A8]